MEEAVQAVAAVADDRVARPLPGLRGVLAERNIGPKQLADHLKIATHVVHAISLSKRRAEPWIIDAIMQYLNTDMTTLLTPKDVPSLRGPGQARRFPSDSKPKTAPAGAITLTVDVNGNKFSVTSEQALTQRLLGRMGEALFLIATAEED